MSLDLIGKKNNQVLLRGIGEQLREHFWSPFLYQTSISMLDRIQTYGVSLKLLIFF